MASTAGGLGQWRSRVEGLGVLVLEASRVKMSEMRGFSLAERAPFVIVLNGEDSERGKIFTLVHELAHLARRASGVCDLRSRGDISTDAEVFCNAVAGRVLLPWSLLSSLEVLKQHRRGDDWTDDDLEAVVRVAGGPSREVVLRRLLDAGYVSRRFYDERTALYSEQYRQFREERKLRQGRGGPRRTGWQSGTTGGRS